MAGVIVEVCVCVRVCVYVFVCVCVSWFETVSGMPVHKWRSVFHL